MGPSRSRREARSRQITGLARWNAKDGSDLHSRTDAHAFTTHIIAGIRPERCGIGRRRRVPVGMASVASQRPTARVAGCGSAKFRLLTCDRRHQHTISAKICAIFDRMSGRRRETRLATKLGELVADGARTRGKCAKPMHTVHAAEACSFCAGSRAGRSIPATCGKRVPAEGEGEMPRGRACAQSRRRYILTGPPAGSTSESAGRDRWPPPSDRVTKAPIEKTKV